MSSRPPSTASAVSTGIRLPSDFPTHLRQLSHHLTAVQARSQILPPQPVVSRRHDDSELQPRDDIQFRPALLAANVHRFILSVLPIYATAAGELARLREWREPRRTAIWAITYSFLWTCQAILPTALAIILAFVLAPHSTAAFLFPSPVDAKEDLMDTIKPEPSPSPPIVGPAHADADFFSHPRASSDEEADVAAATIAAIAAQAVSLPSSPTPIMLTPPDSNSRPRRLHPGADTPPPSQTSFLPPKYRPHVEKYGGGVQRIAAGLADGHERLRNLFRGRFVHPLPRAKHAVQGTAHSETWVAPNVRLAGTIGPLFIFSLMASTEMIARTVTFALGIALFVLEPLQVRVAWVAVAVDPDQSLLKDVPTDRAWILAELRRIKREGGMKALAAALRWLESGAEDELGSGTGEEDSPSGKRSDVASVRSMSSSSASSGRLGKASKRLRIVGAARRVQRAAEIGTEILNGQRTFTLDLSRLGRALGTAEDGDKQKVRSKVPPPLPPRSRPTSLYSATTITLKEAEEEEDRLGRFGCCYGKMPGELKITTDYVSFDSGMGFLNTLQKREGPMVEIKIQEIVSIRKQSGVGITGLWGGIDGLEIVVERKSGDHTELNVQDIEDHEGGESDESYDHIRRKAYRFWNVSRRDLAFIWLVVMREWEEEEDLNRTGWIAT